MQHHLAPVALAVAALAAGCGDDGAAAVDAGGPDASTLTGNRRFAQLIDGYDDLPRCQAEAPPGLNCLRWLELCANGGFVLVVTDIVNEGTYVMAGSAVTATRQAPGDGPASFTLTLGAAGFTSPELAGRHPWSIDTLDADEARGLAESCAALTGRTWWPT